MTRSHGHPNLRAWYVTRAFGIEREVRAVDDVSLSVDAQRDLRPGR